MVNGRKNYTDTEMFRRPILAMLIFAVAFGLCTGCSSRRNRNKPVAQADRLIRTAAYAQEATPPQATVQLRTFEPNEAYVKLWLKTRLADLVIQSANGDKSWPVGVYNWSGSVGGAGTDPQSEVMGWIVQIMTDVKGSTNSNPTMQIGCTARDQVTPGTCNNTYYIPSDTKIANLIQWIHDCIDDSSSWDREVVKVIYEWLSRPANLAGASFSTSSFWGGDDAPPIVIGFVSSILLKPASPPNKYNANRIGEAILATKGKVSKVN